jgi:hypothetical protein
VVVSPLITIGPLALRHRPRWSGLIPIGSRRHASLWFREYWTAFRPYALAASRSGADEVRIGTEFSALEGADPALWQRLVSATHRIFPGRIYYEINWSSLGLPIRPWMRDPRLTIGISEWISLGRPNEARTFDLVNERWAARIRPRVDSFAERLGKPVIVSELAYRTTADCLSKPFVRFSSARPDPTCQAQGYAAALGNMVPDPHVTGVFIWGWSLPLFGPKWQPGATVLKRWFSTMSP